MPHSPLICCWRGDSELEALEDHSCDGKNRINSVTLNFEDERITWAQLAPLLPRYRCQIITRNITEHTRAQEPYQVHLFQTVTSPRRLIYMSPNDTYGAIYLVAVVV